MHNVTLLKLGLLAFLASGCGRPSIVADPQADARAAAPATAAAPTPQPAAAAQAPAPVAASTTGPASPPSSTATPAAARATALRVDRMVVARGIVDREPQGTDTLFAANEKRVYAFVEIANPERAEGNVQVEFVGPDGKAQPTIDVSVGASPRWRTWAFTRRAQAPGMWKAIVRDTRGRVLASTAFEVRA